jgi:hypothetical protein
LVQRWLKVNFGIKEFVLIIVDSSITKSMSLDLWKHGVFVVYTICILLLQFTTPTLLAELKA